MAKGGIAAGVVVHRRTPRGLEVLLVHPSGNYNRRASWGIPKGLVEPGEELAETAARELEEETGVVVDVARLEPLGFVDYQKSRKRVHGFRFEAAPDVAPRCASWEIDAAEFLDLEVARERMHVDQRAFLDRLVAVLDGREPPGKPG